MVREPPGSDPEVPRGLQKRKKDPDFRFCVHAVAIGAERATCSQNFRPLAALEAEITTFVTIIIY